MEKRLSRKKALRLLQRYGVSQNVIEHSFLVEENALKIANQLKAHGVKIDEEFLSIAAILHDVGRYKVALEKGHSKEELGLHAPEGQILLEKLGFPELAKIAGGHFLGGVSGEEAERLGWPISVKLPNKIEAKIIFIADKIRGEKPVEEEIEALFSREDLHLRYWNKIPGFKEKILKRTHVIIDKLKSLGWNGKVYA